MRLLLARAANGIDERNEGWRGYGPRVARIAATHQEGQVTTGVIAQVQRMLRAVKTARMQGLNPSRFELSGDDMGRFRKWAEIMAANNGGEPPTAIYELDVVEVEGRNGVLCRTRSGKEQFHALPPAAGVDLERLDADRRGALN
jgi:hypothetical protein